MSGEFDDRRPFILDSRTHEIARASTDFRYSFTGCDLYVWFWIVETSCDDGPDIVHERQKSVFVESE